MVKRYGPLDDPSVCTNILLCKQIPQCVYCSLTVVPSVTLSRYNTLYTDEHSANVVNILKQIKGKFERGDPCGFHINLN